jgi:hypothetical protein
MSTITQVIPVPLSGLGASVDVSSMVGSKTVILTGTFRGVYVLYGSHVGGNLAPLFQFDAGGVEGLRRTISGALARVAIKSLASDASGVTASISGDSVPGDNTFATLGTLAPGASGAQPSYDLGTSNYQSGLNFILAGGLQGKLVVEGSSDNVRWNPIGQFSADPSGPGLLGPSPSPEFAPLETEDLVRYVRLNVLGTVTSTLVVTVGGSKSGGGGGAFETLAQTYQVGSSVGDQTMVLADARGGGVVEDATGAGFTGTYAYVVLVSDPIVPGASIAGAGLRRGGGMDLGPYDIVVGFATGGPIVPPASALVGQQRIVIGNAVLNVDPANPAQSQVVVIGCDIAVNTQCVQSVVIGATLTVGHLGGDGGNSVVIGYNSGIYSSGDVVVGTNNHIGGGQGNNISFGNNHNLNNGGRPESDGYNCLVAGMNVTLDGESSQGVGDQLEIVGDHSFAGGSDSSVFADWAVELGYSNIVNGSFDVVVGSSLTTPVNGSRLTSGTIDSVSNAGGGSVTIHSSDIPAGLVGGQRVTIGGTTIYDGTFAVANVTAGTFDIVAVWSVTTTGYFTARAVDGRNIYVGTNIQGAAGTGNDDVRQIVIGTDIVGIVGSKVIVIGTSASSTVSTNVSSVVVGDSANVSHSYTMVFGSNATSTADHQVIFGVSGSAGAYAIHEFVVRGYNGAALNTLDAVDNPVDSGNPNLAVSGLTVVVTQGAALSNKTLKAAPFANLPGGALVAYLE